MSDERPQKLYAHLLKDSVTGMTEGWEVSIPRGNTLSEDADEIENKLGMLGEYTEVVRSEVYTIGDDDE
jgi:hypothetical protein